MKNENYEIPAEVGYTKDLTFRIVPVSKAIMTADADWLKNDELCLDAECAEAILLPFIEEYTSAPFRDGDEINTIRFVRAKRLSQDLRTTAAYLKKDPAAPALAELVSRIDPEMILPRREFSRLKKASEEERREAVYDHMDMVIEFYLLVSDYLLDMMEKYEPLGFRHFAVTSE